MERLLSGEQLARQGIFDPAFDFRALDAATRQGSAGDAAAARRLMATLGH